MASSHQQPADIVQASINPETNANMIQTSRSSRRMLPRTTKTSTIHSTLVVFFEKSRNEKASYWTTRLLTVLRLLLTVLIYRFVFLPMIMKTEAFAGCPPYYWSTCLKYFKLDRIIDTTWTFTCLLFFISVLALLCFGQALFWVSLKEKTERAISNFLRARLDNAATRKFSLQRTLLIATLTTILPVYYSAQEIRILRRECRSERKLDEFSGEARRCYDKLSELIAEIADNLALDGIE